MFPGSIEPTEILHYAYLDVRFFPINFPTETAAMCHYRTLNHYTSMDS